MTLAAPKGWRSECRTTPGPLCLAGGINDRHPDGRDLERASQFAAGTSRKVWQNEAVVAHV